MTGTRFDLDRRALLAAAAGLVALPPGMAWAQAGAAPAGPPRRGGVARISTSQRVSHLNPLRHIINPDYLVGEMMYAGLTRLAIDGMRPEPDVAESWEANADATVWTFKVRSGVRFHHGPSVTAKDVEATLKAVLDPATASPGLRNIGPIREVVALDERTVRITLNGPFADLPVNLAHTNARILPAEVIARDIRAPDTQDFGCGPFKLARHDPGRLIKLERFEGYHFQPRPYLDGVEVALYPDIAGEAAALINNETDILLLGNPSDFPRMQRTAGLRAIRTPSGRFHNIVMRHDQAPFNDIRVRRALQLCVDRQAMADLVIEGLGRPAPDNPISPEYQYHDASAQSPARNAQAARRLLAEAGHPNGLRIQLVCSNRPPTRTQMGVALKEMAQPGGFNIEVQTIPHDQYLANVWRKGNFYIGTFNMQPHEDALFTLLFTGDAPWNDTKWDSGRFDELVYGARRITDQARRRALYSEAQKLLVAQIPYLIPFYEDLISVTRNHVAGYTVHPRGGVFFLDHTWLGEGAPRRG
jgi:peptide/nickel transport system substrate-binding protein